MPAKLKSRSGAVSKGRGVYAKASRASEKLQQIGKLGKEKPITPRQVTAKKAAAAKEAAAARAKRTAEALGDVRRRNAALSEQADRLLERFG